MNDNNDSNTQEQHTQPAAGSDAPGTPSDQPQGPAEDQRGPYKQKRDYSHVRVFGFPLLEFLQVFFNGLLVIAGIVGAVVILRQLDIMEEQMADAQQSGIEQQRTTNRALRIAEDQAKALRDLVPATTSAAAAAKLSAEGTIKIAEVSTRQVAIADKQAGALSSQAESGKAIAKATENTSATNERLAAAAAATADTQKRANALEHGAWVWFRGVAIVQNNQITTGSPFVGVKASLQFTLTNEGRAPAEEVYVQTVTIEQGDKRHTATDPNHRSIAGGESGKVDVFIGPLDLDVPLFRPRATIRITATLAYKDGFSESRGTLACYESVFSEQALGVRFSPCGGHNTAVDSNGARPPND